MGNNREEVLSVEATVDQPLQIDGPEPVFPKLLQLTKDHEYVD